MLPRHLHLLFVVLVSSCLFLNHHQQSHAQPSHPVPPLHQAALDGDLEEIQRLTTAEEGFSIEDLNKPDPYVGVPVLYAAARNGHVDVVRYLIEVDCTFN